MQPPTVVEGVMGQTTQISIMSLSRARLSSLRRHQKPTGAGGKAGSLAWDSVTGLGCVPSSCLAQRNSVDCGPTLRNRRRGITGQAVLDAGPSPTQVSKQLFTQCVLCGSLCSRSWWYSMHSMRSGCLATQEMERALGIRRAGFKSCCCHFNFDQGKSLHLSSRLQFPCP